MKINKQVRVNVWAKYDFKCGYCGKDIEFKDMQVDHIHPKCSVHFTKDHKANYEKIHSFDNYMPTCRSCNHYKRGDSLEQFRTKMKTIHNRIEKDYISKVALDYGIMNLKPFNGTFFFETHKGYKNNTLNHKRQIIRILKIFQLNFDKCFDGDLISSFSKYYTMYHYSKGGSKNKNYISKGIDIKYNDFSYLLKAIQKMLPEKPVPNLSLIKISDKRVAEIWLSKIINHLQNTKRESYILYGIDKDKLAIDMIDGNMPYEISIYNNKQLKVSFNHCCKNVQEAYKEAMDYLRNNKCYWEHKKNHIELEQFGGFKIFEIN